MFWKLTSLSASSPVEALLDKESFTLEELLDEEEIIQECKALNNRLINFLRDKAQVEQLLRYVIEEPAEDAESKRAFKFPFIACEVFTCEIDVILRTLVEEEELMDLLFSFLEPNRSHSALLAGYFSKVVVCLMLRKTVPLMNYVQAHQCVFQKLVDLIGITSIMEVLVRLLGADDHINTNDVDLMRWLADTHLLEMIVDKLSPTCPPEVQANAAETLCALTQNTGSAIATKLSSASFVSRIFSHALEESPCKSGLVYSLCVCISLLDPRRSASSLLFHSMRGQYLSEAPIMANPETVNAMLPKLGDLLMHLNLSSNEKGLPTPYGELRPPLGKHRLKIVEFIAVLLKAGSETAREELVNSGTVKRVIDLLFEYPYNNALHHHVESIISSCLESHSDNIIDHLFKECDIIRKILQADKHQMLLVDSSLLTVPAAGKKAPRAGYLGHITLISNKIVQLGQSNGHIQKYVKDDGEWNEWVSTVLQDRNVLENVYRWACGRPTTLHDRTRDSDDDDLRDRDFDVADLANNLSQAFRPDLFGNMGSEEDNGAIDHNDEDVYFDDGSAEVVISSLRLGDDQGSLFTNSNWFTFRDERSDNAPVSTSLSDMMEEINLNETKDEGNSTSDDEVVVGVDEDLIGKKNHSDGACSCHESLVSGIVENNTVDKGELSSKPEASNTAGEVDSFQFRKPENEDQCGDRPLLDCAGWEDSSEPRVGGSSLNPFVDHVYPEPNSIEAIAPSISSCSSGESTLPNGTLTSVESGEASCASDVDLSAAAVPSLFEEDVEFVGVEQEGTEKAMEQALKEGIIGEAGPLKRDVTPNFSVEKSDDPGMQEFNDTNYWRVEQGVAVRE